MLRVSFLLINVLFFVSIWITPTRGHGYVTSPRSRNWFAHQDGIEYEQAGLPKREYCQHCLNRNTGVCGYSPSKNYDDWIDSTGQPMPWISEAVYQGGDVINIKSTLTTHHGGHAEFRACALGRDSTQECLDSYVLEFVSDPLNGMPKDPNYPERGYYAGWNTQMRDFSMNFKLPPGLSGDNVLLQWRYITANSCSPPGYEDYFNGGNSQARKLPSTWYSGSISDCTLPYPQDGSVGPGQPEQFFNCMEVTVLPPPPTVSPAPTGTPVTLAPTPTSAPTSLTARLAPPQDSRMVAYLGNWQSCPTAAQLSQYSHVVIAFAVTYTWNPTKNSCNSACQIDTPPVCNNSPNPSLIQDLHDAGKSVILSFGGAGMGGSWDGDVNDCWADCFGKEDNVVTQLVKIVDDMNLDGVDIDYEWFYEDDQNGSGFAKGTEAIDFLRKVTVGLRSQLPKGSIVTHAPMDVDIVQGTAYFNMLQEISHTLDFLMPQYYNGVTRPIADGFGNNNIGQVSTADHYQDIVNLMFNGDATKLVFGFCIQDCSFTGSNANAAEAASVMEAVNDAYSCNGGAFFWVAEHDRTGQWSSMVNIAMDVNRGCSGGIDPVGFTPVSPVTPVAPTPQMPNPSPVAPAPSPVGSVAQCCPSGFSGYRAFNDCSQYYRCVAGNIVGITASCAPGTRFDTSLQNCNWASAITACSVDPCEPPPGPPTGAPITPTVSPVVPTAAPIDQIELSVRCCPPGFVGNRPFADCASYYKCENGMAVGSINACDEGFLFDQNTNSCEVAGSVTCIIDACSIDIPPKKVPTFGSKDDSAKLYNDNERGNLQRRRRATALRGY